MKSLHGRKGEEGFTLIEIIAVLVLLGVLAAVIIPRYNSITQEARIAALQQAIAEGQAQVNQAAAKYILSAGVVPTTVTQITGATMLGATSTAIGDYVLTYGGVAGGVAITAANAATASISATGSAAFPN